MGRSAVVAGRHTTEAGGSGRYGGMVRTTATRRPRTVILTLVGVVLLGITAVVVARMLLASPAGVDFVAGYPGDTGPPPGTPVGFPAWLSWQHFLSGFLLVFIVRSGLQIRSKQRPPAFWTRRNDGLIRTRTSPRRLSIHTWWHLVVDGLWVANGVVYVVLLFASGHWLRMVPTSWEVIPNAVSAGLQYVAFDWPAHDGWVSYNSLQLLFYFATVFVASPLALLTGLRLSPSWPDGWTRVNRMLSESLVRRIHWIVLWYFIAFTVAHVTLVFTTGALRNLNHMYAGRDDESWIGVGVWALSMAVTVGGYLLARPAQLARLAELSGTVRRMPAPARD